MLKQTNYDNNLQTANFNYNLRGWLVSHSVNKNSDSSNIFSYTLYYDNPKKPTPFLGANYISTPQYNGNISFSQAVYLLIIF